MENNCPHSTQCEWFGLLPRVWQYFCSLLSLCQRRCHPKFLKVVHEIIKGNIEWLHNFIAYFQKGGDFSKSYWAKWPRKLVSFFHCETVKESNMFMYKPCSSFKTLGLIRLSRILSQKQQIKFQSFHVQIVWQYNSHVTLQNVIITSIKKEVYAFSRLFLSTLAYKVCGILWCSYLAKQSLSCFWSWCKSILGYVDCFSAVGTFPCNIMRQWNWFLVNHISQRETVFRVDVIQDKMITRVKMFNPGWFLNFLFFLALIHE